MSDMFWSPELQNRLKKTRLNAGIQADELARYCALSVAQLTQLEEGGDSQFYNQRIKFRSGVKALSALVSAVNEASAPNTHLPPPATTHTHPPTSFNDSEHQRLDRIAQIQPTHHKFHAQEKKINVSLSSRLYLLGAIVISCLSLFLVLELDFPSFTYLNHAQESPLTNEPTVTHATQHPAGK